MKNQDLNEFISQIFCDWKIQYKDTIYFFDGYSNKDESILHVYTWKKDNLSGFIEKDIVFQKPTMEECKKEFFASKIFDGNSFFEVQDNMEVIED